MPGSSVLQKMLMIIIVKGWRLVEVILAIINNFEHFDDLLFLSSSPPVFKTFSRSMPGTESVKNC